MDFNRRNIKIILMILFAAILFYLIIRNISSVADAMGTFQDIMFPFILGGGIAFVINVPMVRIESLVFSKTLKLQKSRRSISIVLTLALVIGIVIIAMYIIIPQIAQTISVVGKEIPDAMVSLQDWISDKTSYWKSFQELADKLSIDWEKMADKLSDYMQSFASNLVNNGIGAITNIVSAIVNFIIGFIFAVYVLMKKETLTRQGKQVILALFSEDVAYKIFYVLKLSDRTFARFISGQCLEACILGMIFFVTMTVIGLPYAMLISVLIAFTALIPMVGAFIGCVLGGLLILMQNPSDALIFVIMFLIIQQIEGNLIYPHVVGSSVGLPSIWVLVAITIGGNLMGIVGMIIFIPICSVLYSVFRIYVKDRLVKKNISPDKWMSPVIVDESILTSDETKKTRVL